MVAFRVEPQVTPVGRSVLIRRYHLSGRAMGSPARRYSWPSFTEGNVERLTHGAYSPRKIEPRAAELVALVETLPWITPADVPALWRWARTYARLELVDEYLDSSGLLDDDGSPRPATLLLHRLETRAETLGARLGLDPLSRARLGRDVAASIDLAQFWASETGGDD